MYTVSYCIVTSVSEMIWKAATRRSPNCIRKTWLEKIRFFKNL